MSEKYLKQINKKIDRLLEIAEQFAEKASVQEEPFYYQSTAFDTPIPETESVNFEINEAPVVKSSKVNNWNKLVSEVLNNMKSSGWKNPNTGKNATRKNAMKEASRRKAEANSNYAATAASRRAKRNKVLASKAAYAAFNAAGAPAAANLPAAAANLPAAAANLPAATAGNVVNTRAAAALLANTPYKGPPRKGIDPPPSIYQKFKGPSVPIISTPIPNIVPGDKTPAQRLARSIKKTMEMPYTHPTWQAHYEKKIKNLQPQINAELAAGYKLENE
jgi:hypothetical protein